MYVLSLRFTITKINEELVSVWMGLSKRGIPLWVFIFMIERFCCYHGLYDTIRTYLSTIDFIVITVNICRGSNYFSNSFSMNKDTLK